MRPLIGVVSLLLFGALKWAFDHFLWDWLIDFLEVNWHFREAMLIAFVSSYVIPALIVAACIVSIYWLAHHDVAQRKTVAMAATSTMSRMGGQSDAGARGETAKTVEQTIDICFEPQFPYIKNEIINGHGLSTVLIGLKAVGRTFSNCRVYVEKVAPAPSLPGFPVLLVDGAQMLRPDDPETLIAVASKWDHVNTYRFRAPPPPMDSHLWNIEDDPPRLIEIKVTASNNIHDFQKTALFRIRVDEQKQLMFQRDGL